ncbi:protein of unknown function (plasmid) [Caballeronia sp. S22]
MKPATLVTLNMRELDRLKVIQAVVDMGLKPGRAAERLGLTVRQVERLVWRYRESGAAGLTSRKRNKPGNRKLDEGLALRALTLIRERYLDFGPTLACEKLRECHGLVLSKETVRHLMTDAGLWVPRKQRPPKVYQPRARRASVGAKCKCINRLRRVVDKDQQCARGPPVFKPVMIAAVDLYELTETYHALSSRNDSLGGRSPIEAVTPGNFDQLVEVVLSVVGIHGEERV